MCILKCLFEKYHQQIAYLFFGILTTLVNYGSFWLSFRLLARRLCCSCLYIRIVFICEIKLLAPRTWNTC